MHKELEFKVSIKPVSDGHCKYCNVPEILGVNGECLDCAIDYLKYLRFFGMDV